MCCCCAFRMRPRWGMCLVTANVDDEVLGRSTMRCLDAPYSGSSHNLLVRPIRRVAAAGASRIAGSGKNRQPVCQEARMSRQSSHATPPECWEEGGVMDACPVCFEEFAPTASRVGPDDALCCKHDHWVCAKCVGRIAKPTRLCSSKCSGLHYACPMCRSDTCMAPMHVLVVMKGSWRQTCSCFKTIHDSEQWSYQRSCAA